MTDWIELGDRCWMRRYPEWDVNVGVIAGTDGVLVLDTRGTVEQGHQLREDVRALDRGQVRFVANTHWHFDHSFGNEAFAADVGDAFYCHENTARDLVPTPALVPRNTFATDDRIDLGDREVRLRHLGRGHTDGDIIAVVDDVVFAGDLIEQSGDPSYGDDCFPLEWPDTVLALATLIGKDTVVVPGHGEPVDRPFVVRQFGDLSMVADLIAQMHRANEPIQAALTHRQWPFAVERLHEAVRRGYEQLGPILPRHRAGRA